MNELVAKKLMNKDVKEKIDKFFAKEEVKDVFDRIFLFPMRVRGRRKSKMKHRERRLAIASMRDVLEKAKRSNAESCRTVFNVGLYILLFDQDVAYFTEIIVAAVGDRKRKLIAKYEAILLFEAAEDLRQLLGKDFRNAVKAIGASDAQIDEINMISAEMHQYWDLNREFLKTIRNILSAHREQDSLYYYEDLEKLQPLEIMRKAAEFSQILEKLTQVIITLMALTSNPSVILRDIVNSTKLST